MIGVKTLLVTNFGKPFTEAGFGNWMRERCDEAGLPDCSSHGLRKAIARRMAEAGMSPHQIQAITGHTTLKEIERYTKAARQKLMAEMAMRGLDEPVAQIEDKR
jgi:integrase